MHDHIYALEKKLEYYQSKIKFLLKICIFTVPLGKFKICHDGLLYILVGKILATLINARVHYSFSKAIVLLNNQL